MRCPVLYNPYCQERRFVFPLPGHWAICIFGKPLGSNKELSKEIMDFDLDKVALRLCCSGLAINLSIIGYYEQQISHKKNFWGVLGNYVLYLIDNKILSQSPNHIFVTKSKRAPSGAVEGLSVKPQAIPGMAPLNCHRPPWKSNFGKNVLRWEKQIKEGKSIWLKSK